ncbi:melatonin receptor type 1B-like [Argopecten irradians]|uniref:melatonin receptor type 1B-like n=1 Tax=Argopecten irradians TaxID=31199 RepID=UPI003718A9E0
MEVLPIFRNDFEQAREIHGENYTGEDIFFWKPLEAEPIITIIFLVCIVVSMLVGFVGNILVIGAVCVHRRLRTTGNVFIVNLAIADLVVVAIVLPYNIVGIVIGPEHFLNYEGICHAVATICVSACACSMMTLAAIALNRYVFVCRNKYYHRIYNKWTTPIMCLFLWILVLCIDMPSYLGWGGHAYDFQTMGCSFDRSGHLSYVLFLSVAIYWVPFILVFICYILIFKYVQKNRKQLRKAFSRISCNNAAVLNTRREEEIRMVRTFFIVVVVFLICWTPYDLLVLFDRLDEAPRLLYIILLTIGHSNSALNSILYASTNRRFRRGYLEFISIITHSQCFRKGGIDSHAFNSTKNGLPAYLKNSSDENSGTGLATPQTNTSQASPRLKR